MEILIEKSKLADMNLIKGFNRNIECHFQSDKVNVKRRLKK